MIDEKPLLEDLKQWHEQASRDLHGELVEIVLSLIIKKVEKLVENEEV